MEDVSENDQTSELASLAKEETGPRHTYPKWLCPGCGAKIWWSNKTRHMETKKHQDTQYVQFDRFEMQ